ncbi:MAG: FtsW/RodA/SpoVE family cell cycle protein [Clostridia bacterium]|nr:FtsW/RodA/SpoVE family cell cycle protein [Clostridia bacterium]
MEKTRSFFEGFINFFKNLFFAVVGYIRDTYRAYWAMCIATTCFGLVIVASATRTADSHRTLIMQILAVTIGYFGALILSNIDYERLGELWPFVGGFTLLLELSCFVIGSDAGNGADDRAWLIFRVGGFGFSFQPSELLKIGFIITFSYHLSKVVRAGKFKNFTQIMLLAIHGMIPVAIVAATGDQGSALVFLFMFIIIMVGAGLAWYYLVLGLGAIGCMVPILWKFLMSNDQKKRFTAVYFPDRGDTADTLYQQNLAKTAIGSGQITGRGLFKGPMVESGKNYADHNDFIFSVVGEELGFIGAVACMLMLFTIMVLTLRAAFKSHDEMGKYICLGYFGMISVQTMINIGMCVGVLPVIGITLPFFSAGGSSSMCMYFGVGLVVSVFMRRKETNLRLNV